MGATNGIKNNIHTIIREAVYFLHEVLMLVIDWGTA